MKYKEKTKEVDMYQYSASNFDRVCDWLGYTPEQIINPMFDINEYGDSRDHCIGIWVKHNPDDENSGQSRCYMGDCIVRHNNGYHEVMNPWDFADKYEKVTDNINTQK